MDVIIVCHTEFGYVDKRNLIFEKKATKGVAEGVPQLVQLAKSHGAKITFAVCPEVVPYFLKGRDEEIGLHVHPGWREFQKGQVTWRVGDSYLREHCQQSSISSGLKDYSYEEQLGMIRTGKEYIAQELNADPKVFVAGRWSVNNNTVRALVEQGFTHDCSPIPASKLDDWDWSHLARISLPYHPSKEDYQEEGKLPLLMIPASKALFGPIVNPESARFCGLSWLQACFSEYYRLGVPLFHISLHSPAMTDPYYRDILDRLLAFIAEHQSVRFRYASEISEYPHEGYQGSVLPYGRAINRDIVKTGLQKAWKILK